MFRPADRELLQRIWGLTWPLIVANALELTVGLVELWLVRPLGQSATAAIGVTRQITFLAEAMALAITAGVIALVSQAVGARGQATAAVPSGQVDPNQVVGQSFALVLLFGVPAALAGYLLAGPLVACLQASAKTQAYAESYLQVYFAGIIVTWGNLVAAALFRGSGDVRTPLKLAVGVSLVQVGLNYLFIYGAGPVPPFEVQGAALGALLARSGGLLLLLLLLVHGTGRLQLRWSALWAPDRGLTRRLLRIGLPMALANVLRHGSRLVFLAIIGRSALQESLQAAATIGFQVRLLGILPALAFQTAAAALVGQALGRGDPEQAEALGRRSVQLLAVLVGSVALILLVAAGPLAQLFIESSAVAVLTAQLIRWFAVAQFFSALSIGLQGALVGGGDTAPALRYTFYGEWCLMLPLSYLMVMLGWVPDGLLAAWLLAPLLTSFLMLRRFRSGQWKGRR